MNYESGKFAYVVNWQDMNGKSHQDEIVRLGFYQDRDSSWIHSWHNIEDGLTYFLTPLPKVNTVVYKISEYNLAVLRSKFIIIPQDELIKEAEEITKVNG